MRISRAAGFQPGQTLQTPRFGYHHKGIATDQWREGEQLVISCSGRAGKVVVERMSEFTRGRGVEPIAPPGSMPAAMVLQRARSMIGQPYSLLDFNCEHFICEAYGVPRESEQMQRALCAVGLFAGLRLLAALKT